MTMTATTVKMFIDIFIGIWAFMLAIIWCAKIECKPGQKAQPIEIWHRFPKFVIGYVLTFFLLLLLCWPAATAISSGREGDQGREYGDRGGREAAAHRQPRHWRQQAKSTTAARDRIKSSQYAA